MFTLEREAATFTSSVKHITIMIDQKFAITLLAIIERGEEICAMNLNDDWSLGELLAMGKMEFRTFG